MNMIKVKTVDGDGRVTNFAFRQDTVQSITEVTDEVTCIEFDDGSEVDVCECFESVFARVTFGN